MAKKPAKRWVYSPKAPPKPSVPAETKHHVQERCEKFTEEVLRPAHIHPPPENARFNYIVALSNLWYRNFFYFCAQYRCPAENCLSEFFEVRYTRMEYAGYDRYTLAYMRHTGQWQSVYFDLSLEDCLKTIEAEELFRP